MAKFKNSLVFFKTKGKSDKLSNKPILYSSHLLRKTISNEAEIKQKEQ